MALIRPFRALRPDKNFAAEVASVPYDVVSRQEAKQFAEHAAHNFLHVTRAEIDLPDAVDAHDATVYDAARDNLAKLLRENVLQRDAEACLYVYRLIDGTHTQTGVVALCAIDEYERDVIKKHERTRPDKEDDRTNHILATNAQTGLIFLAYRGAKTIDEKVSSATTTAPLYDFTATDGVQHTIWKIQDSTDLINAFHEIPTLYIADGHHRAAAAARARQKSRAQNHNQNGDYDYVVAALFPREQLRILAYNRAIRDLDDLSDAEFLQRVNLNFAVEETNVHVPTQRGEFCLYLSGKWYKLRFNVSFFRQPDTVDALDVSLLQNFLFAPVLNIEDPRTNPRIEFVGGARGTRELEKMVDEGRARAAVSLFPTSIEDLLAVSDAGDIMPPKSTWFEPKLRDGLLIHVFDV